MFKFYDLIEEVSEFNTDLKYGLNDIIGVTIEKGLISTVANLTQTALDKFYIIRPNTFIYNPRTHGVRLGMGFNESDNVYITSWNNVAFKVKYSAKEIVLPKFLWLYFLRPDWDRLSNFLAWGSSTIVFAWKDFLDIEISLPSIEKQREIVAEYNTLQNRIETNKKLVATLEQTAQTLYRHTFVDNIDPNNLPDGWRMGTVGEIAKVKVGGDKPDVFSEEKSEKCKIPIYSNGLENKGIYGYTDRATIFEKCVTVSARGTIGYCCLREEPFVPIVRLLVVIPNDENMVDYLYRQLKDLNFEGSGSVQNQLTAPHIENQEILIPDSGLFKEYNEKLNPVMALINNKEQENQTLTQMQTLLLSKMGV